MKWKLGLLWLGLLMSANLFAAEPIAEQGVIRFNANASLTLPNDVMQVMIGANSQDDKAEVAAANVNDAISWALKIIKAHPELEVSTTGYRTQPIYRAGSSKYDSNQIHGWHASQQLQITSRDFAMMGKVLAILQQKLQIESTNMQPNAKSQAAAADQLLVLALQDFERRAQLIQKTMGAQAYRVLELNVNNHQPQYYANDTVMYASKSAKSEVAIEAGQSDLQLNINASIQLQF